MYCKSCGKEIESNGDYCSKCGFPVSDNSESESTFSAGANALPTRKKKKPLVLTIIGIIVAIILALAFIKSLDPYGNVLNVDTLREVYSYSQEVICEEVLWNPSDAEFPKFDPEFVTRNEKRTIDGAEYYMYTVTAYVDTTNLLGAKFRQNFTIEIGLPVDKNNENIYYYNIISTNP